MSHSKNYYQGYHLGRVQRSEYDDSKLRDLARQDAKLGESLKTVERAKNVMKKSLEADRQMFIKIGSQTANKTPSHGVQARSCAKAISQHVKPGTETRVKRFSVTDMPSDLDRSISHRGRFIPRPTSYHELTTESLNPDTHLSREVGHSIERLLESSSTSQGSLAMSHISHTEIVPTSGVLDRLSGYDSSLNSEIENRNINPANRSGTETPKYGKYISKTEQEKMIDSRLWSKETNSGTTSEVAKRTDEQTLENNEDIKNKRQENQTSEDQDFRARKRSTIWETLSTPKHTSNTKSKRSQIQMEFTASNLKSSKSSPALFTGTKIKATAGQGKTAQPGNGSVQGRHFEGIDGVKMKPPALK